MKSGLFFKFKRYIAGLLLFGALLSVSVSFCSWDKINFSTKFINNIGNYAEKYSLVVDNNSNKLADVGEVITFGNYYQDSNDNIKTPIRWIVIEKSNNQLTLLTEKVVAFGSFYGTLYYNGTEWVSGANDDYYQNYNKSTLRAWLNSTSTREDGGTQISESSAYGERFKGFYALAFNEYEKSVIIPKNITNMSGSSKNTQILKENFANSYDKVWPLSYSEIYGNTTIVWGENASDGLPNKQFSYFTNTTQMQIETMLAAKATAFAKSHYSNFGFKDAIHSANNYTVNDICQWWLRTPAPFATGGVMLIDLNGGYSAYNSPHSNIGVRPSIIIPV